MRMKYLTCVATILILFQSCRPTEKNKIYFHSLKPQLSSFFSTNDTLFETFYNREFLLALDTMKFEGRDMPNGLSLIEYYGASFYSVAHFKILFASYPKMGRIYFFDYKDKGWQLKLSTETSSKALDSIQIEIKNSIDKDRRQFVRDSISYRIGDMARFSVKRKTSNAYNTTKITLNKPGDNLLNTLMELMRE